MYIEHCGTYIRRGAICHRCGEIVQGVTERFGTLQPGELVYGINPKFFVHAEVDLFTRQASVGSSLLRDAYKPWRIMKALKAIQR